MRMRGLVVAVIVAGAVGWVGRSVYSEDTPPGGMAEAFKKLAKPGEQHARLKALVGEWNVHGKFTAPDGKVVETDSTASMSMVLGDRFLRQEFVGTFEGERFVGRGLIGFDNATKRYVTSWIDSMGTGIMTGEGEETETGKVWKFKSSFNGPSGPISMRDVLTVVGDKEMTWESYMGDGPVPMMSLRYKRK
jgi:Protein of unknown function (DUF1579)